MKGYAVVTDGVIDIRTVGPTEQSAMVNWLYVVPRWAVTKEATFEQIKDAFDKVTATYKSDVAVKPVTIEVAKM